MSPFDTLGLCKSNPNDIMIEDDCFGLLEKQIITIFLTMMVKTFMEALQPYAIQKVTAFFSDTFYKRSMIHPFTHVDEEI